MPVREIAQELLVIDGMPTVWTLQVIAADLSRDGHPHAAEALMKVADAAEEIIRRQAAA